MPVRKARERVVKLVFGLVGGVTGVDVVGRVVGGGRVGVGEDFGGDACNRTLSTSSGLPMIIPMAPEM